jgi:hypothetical protein
MRRIQSDGEHRDATASEVAEYDQIEAHNEHLARQIMSLRLTIKQAAMNGDEFAVSDLTGKLNQLIRAEWPNAEPAQINFIMYLLNLIDQASEWTDHNFQVQEMMLRIVGSLQRPTHPLWSLPGFDLDSLGQDVEDMLQATSRQRSERFTTDTGVELVDVHPSTLCYGQFCVVHHPVPGPWDTWRTHWRSDQNLMVRICEHGVEHPAMEEQLRMPLLGMIAHQHPDHCTCACSLARCEEILNDQGDLVGFKTVA